MESMSWILLLVCFGVVAASLIKYLYDRELVDFAYALLEEVIQENKEEVADKAANLIYSEVMDRIDINVLQAAIVQQILENVENGVIESVVSLDGASEKI